MRLLRITKLTGVLIGLVFLAIIAPLLIHLIQLELDKLANAPRPIVATVDEAREIVVAVIKEMKFSGVPLPPPESGKVLDSLPPRILIVSDLTICTSDEQSASRCDSRLSSLILGYLSHRLDSLVSRKFREELLVANQNAHPFSFGGMANTKIVDSKAIAEALSSDGWWDNFYERYPNTSGFVEVTLPVLTKDRQRALFYIEHHCDGLCGSGTLLLLERSNSEWRVIKKEMLWIS
jgi:hypothetical protein